ncbi:MAG: hypothetical protein SGPRY_007048, partial [Prymnesium sp.]
ECKAKNANLVDFLVAPQTLRTLIEYVTTMPTENDSEARRYKYPYVASEVLCSDVAAVREALVANEGALIVSLFSVLDMPAPLPTVLAGYVRRLDLSKIMLACHKAQPDLMKAFVNPAEHSSNGELSSALAWPNLMPRLLGHLSSDSILQLLLTTCLGEGSVDDGDTAAPASADRRPSTPPSPLLPINDLVPALLDLLPSDAETSANAAELLCGILSAPLELPLCMSGPNVGPRASFLIECCTGGEDNIGRPLNNGALEVLLKLLVRCRETPPGPSCTAAIAETLYSSIELLFVSIAIPSVRRAQHPSLASLLSPLSLPPHIARFLPQGGEAFPLGSSRQRCGVLALLQEGLLTGYEQIATALIELGLFPLVLDMLLLPHSCNMLHMRAASILGEAAGELLTPVTN